MPFTTYRNNGPVEGAAGLWEKDLGSLNIPQIFYVDPKCLVLNKGKIGPTKKILGANCPSDV